MRSKENDGLKVHQSIVDSGDGFEVEMVGRLVQNQNVGTKQHHSRKHAANLLTTGKNLYRLVHIIAGEEHSSQESTQIGFGDILGILRQPLKNVELAAIKVFRVILREVGTGGADTPLDRTFVRLDLLCQNLHHGSLCNLVFSDECDLVALCNGEGDVVEYLYPVDCLADAVYCQNILTDFTIHGKADIWIFSGRSRQFFNGQLIDELSSGGCLFGFGFVCSKARDKVLQFFDLFVCLAFLVSNHALHQSAGLIPEVVVTNIHLDLVVVDIHDVGADIIEEVTVMGYDDNGSHIIHQKFFQPVDGSKVQMVGRLVEEDDFRLTKQCLSQQDFDLFLVAKCAHLFIQQVLVKAKTF